MRRLRRGVAAALLLSVILILTDPFTGDTVIVPWCEIWPIDPLCWFLP